MKSIFRYDSYKFALQMLNPIGLDGKCEFEWPHTPSFEANRPIHFCVGDINEITCSKFQVKWTSSGCSLPLDPLGLRVVFSSLFFLSVSSPSFFLAFPFPLFFLLILSSTLPHLCLFFFPPPFFFFWSSFNKGTKGKEVWSNFHLEVEKRICLVEFSFGRAVLSLGISLVCREILSNFHLGECIFNLIFKILRNLKIESRSDDYLQN